ncbi:stressosome-associated protein Prli42 [Paenibacillus validus]|uniref:Stressosome-associated protein Prli42 n=1 Tax=Paenibacillus validus TaxID=44253 RepID=A0A7X3CSC9_9BACL|nr:MULTISPECIES: stressosome-associated protein Prli42 [Paenibacillus]MED4603562.1 stressosome-associated protein Prli42 [Paenibacillus validus]MED4609557.1 stressosome-associated protein Prli42 [Paenibacillus validus]MUG71635.1 stressosome-associated protein Prli42 [Paenibacillus validus]
MQNKLIFKIVIYVTLITMVLSTVLLTISSFL